MSLRESLAKTAEGKRKVCTLNPYVFTARVIWKCLTRDIVKDGPPVDSEEDETERERRQNTNAVSFPTNSLHTDHMQ